MVQWIPNVKSLRIPKILVSLSNLLYITVYKYQGFIPKILVSCGLSNLLHFYCIHSMHTIYLCASHISQRFLLSCGLSNQGSRIYRKNFAFLRIVQSRFPHIHVYCTLVSRALRSFPHTVGCYTLVLQQEEASLLTLGRL